MNVAPQIYSRTEKEEMAQGQDRFVENADVSSSEKAAVGTAMDDHERRVMTRRILLKLDLRILPVFAVLFLCSFLDRTNVGNAKIYNLEKDINITDHQYDTGLVVYYATYIASELPSNLVLKRISPRIWLPFLTFAWGVITMCLGFVQNYAGFMAVRAILGAAEGGLLPGMVLYLSGMYTRGEMALRIGLFYTSASLSGAFGGLLARGLSAIGPHTSLAGWRWIFIIEGLFTALVGIGAYFCLPNTLATVHFLTPDERALAQQRLIDDKPLGGLQHGGDHYAEPFTWTEVRRGLIDPQLWLSALSYFSILSGLYSFGLFLPTIISELGYTANEAQLWSVIPYAVAAVITVFVAIISDRLRLRGVIMLFVLPLAIIGYAVIANIGQDPTNNRSKVKYGMTFLMATGMYAAVPCVLSWVSNNSAGHYKRATTTAMQLAIANSGGFVAAFIYPSSQGPNYHKGHTIILGLLVFAEFMVLFNVLYLAKVNRDKRAGKYDKYAGLGDDRDPGFKMVL